MIRRYSFIFISCFFSFSFYPSFTSNSTQCAFFRSSILRFSFATSVVSAFSNTKHNRCLIFCVVWSNLSVSVWIIVAHDICHIHLICWFARVRSMTPTSLQPFIGRTYKFSKSPDFHSLPSLSLFLSQTACDCYQNLLRFSHYCCNRVSAVVIVYARALSLSRMLYVRALLSSQTL